MKITRFEEIESWKMARELTRSVYRLVKDSGFSMDLGLRDQVCRAAVSVMANIAEGFDSGSKAEFARFLSYAQRSCSELQSEMYVALDQDYISQQQFEEVYSQAEGARVKLGAFIKYLKGRTNH
jgi:four helix bundle protein